MNSIKFVFFGTSEFSVGVLEALKQNGLLPTLVVSTEDKPKGRGLETLPTDAKIWAGIHGIPVYQPASLRVPEVAERLRAEGAELFIVAAYGKLIPKDVFELPPHKTLNVHPSLLPKLRGASPIQSSILSEDETGVTIMEINERMDEGSIVAQEKVSIPEWPARSDMLTELLAKRGGEMLAKIMPDWIEGKLHSTPQDNARATYCAKVQKEDGLIDLNDDPATNLRKVKAYYGWPSAYMFYKKKNGEELRIVIKDAEVRDGEFIPLRVVPAGKKEMDWQDFQRGNH